MFPELLCHFESLKQFLRGLPWGPKEVYRRKSPEPYSGGVEGEVKEQPVKDRTGDLGLVPVTRCAALEKKGTELCWLDFLTCNRRKFGSVMEKAPSSRNSASSPAEKQMC